MTMVLIFILKMGDLQHFKIDFRRNTFLMISFRYLVSLKLSARVALKNTIFSSEGNRQSEKMDLCFSPSILPPEVVALTPLYEGRTL
jgi:hypothetical protein